MRISDPHNNLLEYQLGNIELGDLITEALIAADLRTLDPEPTISPLGIMTMLIPNSDVQLFFQASHCRLPKDDPEWEPIEFDYWSARPSDPTKAKIG